MFGEPGRIPAGRTVEGVLSLPLVWGLTQTPRDPSDLPPLGLANYFIPGQASHESIMTNKDKLHEFPQGSEQFFLCLFHLLLSPPKPT